MGSRVELNGQKIPMNWKIAQYKLLNLNDREAID